MGGLPLTSISAVSVSGGKRAKNNLVSFIKDRKCFSSNLIRQSPSFRKPVVSLAPAANKSNDILFLLAFAQGRVHHLQTETLPKTPLFLDFIGASP